MNKYKLLSYIIPTYNAEQFLEETVESVFKQDLKISFEVILSDDNSKDGTRDVIKKLALKHPEIKYFFNEKNVGAPNNRNFAISQSRGDLIYMLDHDNILDHNSIEKLVYELENTNFHAASFQEQIFFKGCKENFRGIWKHDFPENIFTIKEYIERRDAPTTSNNYLYTRRSYNKIGGYPDLGGRENFGFGLRMLANGFQIKIVPGTRYYHRIVNNGLWLTEAKNKTKNGENMVKVLREFLDCFDLKSQKLINSRNAYKKIDIYMTKKKLRLSNKGWDLAGNSRKSSKYNSIFEKIKLNALSYYKRNLYKTFTVLFNFNAKKEKKIFLKNYLFYKKFYLKIKDELNEKSLPFLLPFWFTNAQIIEKSFLCDFGFNFLSHPIIKRSMFIKPKWQDYQLSYLEKKYQPNELKKILFETKNGQPTICKLKYRSSANSIHHLNHLSLFEDKTGCRLKEIHKVVEWGGGYGNLAKIFLRINPDVTYTIIDLPIFVFIQALYLSSVFSQDRINIITENNCELKSKKINLIPLNRNLLENINFNIPDIFISTWALSESNKYSQDIVEQFDFFYSRYLLIAHQESSEEIPYADQIVNKLTKFKVLYHKKIHYIRNQNCYLFAGRK